jgi:predicted Fe-S protein YdhL (DUF1289 family)
VLILGATLIPIMAAMETPCDKVCTVDHASGLCLGCGRTLEEIGSWTALSDQERSKVMAELPRRMEALRARGVHPAKS